MSSDYRSITEELARAKGHFHHHDVNRALVSLALAMKGAASAQIFGRQKLELERAVQEMVQLLNRTDDVLQYLPEGIVFAKGGYKKLLGQLAALLQRIKEEAAKESLEATRERKLKMDNLLIRGQKYLENKNLADAAAAFQEAVSLYVDEHKLFFVIGNKLMHAGIPQQALPYFLKGMEVDSDAENTYISAAKAYEALKQYDKAEQVARKSIKKYGEAPETLEILSLVSLRKGKGKEAYALARKALLKDPSLIKAKKIMAKVKQRAAAAKQA